MNVAKVIQNQPRKVGVNSSSQRTDMLDASFGNKNNMKWGGITWVFLHTLSYKVHPEHYQQIKGELWYHIKQLCSALPCPECSYHAAQYLKKINTPDTKDQLIRILFDFHNVVNIRTRNPIFSFKEFDKYRTVDLRLAFYAYKHVIQHQPYNPRLIMHKVSSHSRINKFLKWLQSHRMI